MGVQKRCVEGLAVNNCRLLRNIMTSDDSPWSIEQIKEYFRKYSSSYDEDLTIDTYPAPFIVSEWIKQTPSIAAQAHVKVMDLGCGTGARYFT